MSDQRTEASATGGNGAAPPAQTGTPTEAAEGDDSAPVGLGGLGDNGEEEGAPSPTTWREDWRDALSNGDENWARQLRRFSTPEAFAKAAFNARARIGSGKLGEAEPPEGASDAEVAIWRKDHGIPDSTDGYDIKFPDGMKPSANDSAELKQFLDFMHQRHVHPSAARAAFEFYMTARADGIERREAETEEEVARNIQALREQFPGREYVRNFGKNGKGGLVNNFLSELFSGPDGEKQLKEVINARVSSGVPLALYAPFVAAMAGVARDLASGDPLEAGDGGGGGQSLDQEYRELVRLERPTPEQRARTMQLATMREAFRVRSGQGRGAS
jgi:hypothetical protein